MHQRVVHRHPLAFMDRDRVSDCQGKLRPRLHLRLSVDIVGDGDSRDLLRLRETSEEDLKSIEGTS